MMRIGLPNSVARNDRPPESSSHARVALEFADPPGRKRSIGSRITHPGEPDLVVEFSICRAHGRALLGAEPHAVIGEVPMNGSC